MNCLVVVLVILVPGYLAWRFGKKYNLRWATVGVWLTCLGLACTLSFLALIRVPILLGVDRVAIGDFVPKSNDAGSNVMLGSASGPVSLSGVGSLAGGGDIPYWDTYVQACRGEHPDCAIILAAVASVESGFDPRARSEAGAMGLFQIMPLHGLGNSAYDPLTSSQFAWKLLKDWGVESDPLKASCRYLRGESGCNLTAGLSDPVTFDYVSDIYGPRSPHLRSRNGVGDSSGGKISQGWHGIAGFKAFDIVAPGLCGDTLLAPLTGVVSYVGDDGLRIGNTMLTIRGVSGAEKVSLLHGNYDVRVGDVVIAGWSRIGTEASNGNSTGCHSHYMYYNKQGVNSIPSFLN